MVLAPAFSESIFHNLDRREKTLAEQVLGEGSNYRTGLFRKTKGLRPDSIINPGKISSRATRFSSQCSVHSEGKEDSQLDLDFALLIHRKVMESLAPTKELKPYIFQKDSIEGWDAIATRLGKTSTGV